MISAERISVYRPENCVWQVEISAVLLIYQKQNIQCLSQSYLKYHKLNCDLIKWTTKAGRHRHNMFL